VLSLSLSLGLSNVNIDGASLEVDSSRIPVHLEETRSFFVEQRNARKLIAADPFSFLPGGRGRSIRRNPQVDRRTNRRH